MACPICPASISSLPSAPRLSAAPASFPIDLLVGHGRSGLDHLPGHLDEGPALQGGGPGVQLAPRARLDPAQQVLPHHGVDRVPGAWHFRSATHLLRLFLLQQRQVQPAGGQQAVQQPGQVGVGDFKGRFA
ncbi:MAG: hypothetical protein ACE5H9_05020 [Anaerolineae bacterium]